MSLLAPVPKLQLLCFLPPLPRTQSVAIEILRGVSSSLSVASSSAAIVIDVGVPNDENDGGSGVAREDDAGLSPTRTSSVNEIHNSDDRHRRHVHRIPEPVWRKAAREHANLVRDILRPGLTPVDHPLNTGLQRQQRQRERKRQREQLKANGRTRGADDKLEQEDGESSSSSPSADWTITALDPQHPVYNFLIEYYGLKGTKGVRRLMKWSPGMLPMVDNIDVNDPTTIVARPSSRYCHRSDILLQGAGHKHFSTNLQTKGAYEYYYSTTSITTIWNNEIDNNRGQNGDCGGIAYSPFRFVYGNKKQHQQHDNLRDGNARNSNINDNDNDNRTNGGGALAAFRWYRSLLKRTIEAPPILHCYGLHEWAMQYQPRAVDDDDDDGTHGNRNRNAAVPSPPPPSSKYQSRLKLRIDQRTLNETVESNTIFCTHVDAWKFFAKEALPLNKFNRKVTVNSNINDNTMTAPTSSSKYTRNKENPLSSSSSLLPAAKDRPTLLLRSEQPACVHTTMDLLKIALKLGPFCNAELFRRVLSVAIEARSLDVAASPYDARTEYGIEAIPIETSQGRKEYKRHQTELMKRTEPIRKDLLENYERFLSEFEQ